VGALLGTLIAAASVSFSGGSALALATDSDTPPVPAIRLNQVGFLPGGPKRAVLVSESARPIAWRLRDAAGAIVLSGETRPFGADRPSGESLHLIDFGAYAGSGDNFRLEADGGATSHSGSRPASTRASPSTRSTISTRAAPRRRSSRAMPAANAGRARPAMRRTARPASRAATRSDRTGRAVAIRSTSRAAGTTPATRANISSTAASRCGPCSTSTSTTGRTGGSCSPTAAPRFPRPATASTTCSTRRAGSWDSSCRCRCPRARA